MELSIVLSESTEGNSFFFLNQHLRCADLPGSLHKRERLSGLGSVPGRLVG